MSTFAFRLIEKRQAEFAYGFTQRIRQIEAQLRQMESELFEFQYPVKYTMSRDLRKRPPTSPANASYITFLRLSRSWNGRVVYHAHFAFYLIFGFVALVGPWFRWLPPQSKPTPQESPQPQASPPSPNNSRGTTDPVDDAPTSKGQPNASLVPSAEPSGARGTDSSSQFSQSNSTARPPPHLTTNKPETLFFALVLIVIIVGASLSSQVESRDGTQ